MASCEQLWEHNWMLYTIDEHYAYFVHMPKPSFSYSVMTTPFITVCQFASAELVAKVPHKVFVEQSERLRTIPGHVVILSTMARSGSALLAQMLQACDASTRNVLVLSEIDAFSAIALHIADFSMPIQTARTLLLASLRFTCKDQVPEQTLILKMRWNCTRLVPHLKAVAPYVIHAYIGRRSLEQAVISQIIVCEHDENIFPMLLDLRRIHPAFCDWVTTFARMEWPLVRMIEPQSIFEFAVALVSQSFIDFVCNQDCFATHAIFYEDLVSDTNETMRRILDVCCLSELCTLDCNDHKTYGQRRSSVEDIEIVNHELADSDRQKLLHICSLIGYPLIEY
ncbi:unnamed protein product [Toxocara canis]|uniref:Sulfotransfer_1 domain-containing protein n=1 Tax=Toxocara canis TaxID=6265 RepID=A0A183UW70_TOXCA|nr:unnamed protein product [Toxocara canis]